MTLHEAMVIVLKELPSNEGSTQLISRKINERKLYEQRSGGFTPPEQIYLRARKYDNLFILIDRNQIKLKKASTGREMVSEPEHKYEFNSTKIIQSLQNNYMKIKDMHESDYSTMPGIYAILFVGSHFPLIEAAEYVRIRPIIYIGKTEKSQRARDLKQHFSNNGTGRSTLRRSLGAILREQLNLKPKPRKFSSVMNIDYNNYRFDETGEEKLTAWMYENLACSFYEMRDNSSDIEIFENEVIKDRVPILNIKNNMGNLFGEIVSEKRKICSELARQNNG